jgi:tetratricopeptide (TPR) repeat protein
MGEQAKARAILDDLKKAERSKWDMATLLNVDLVEADLARFAGDRVTARRLLDATLARGASGLEVSQRNHALLTLALVDLDDGQAERAVSSLRDALGQVSRKTPYIRARYLNVLGKALRKLGAYDEAVATLEEGLVLIRSVDDPLGEVLALDEIGKALLAHGRPEAARERFEQALSLKRRLGDEHGIAISRDLLVRCERRPDV